MASTLAYSKEEYIPFNPHRNHRGGYISSVVSVVVCRWLAVATGLYINRGMMFRRPRNVNNYDLNPKLLCFLWIAWSVAAAEFECRVERSVTNPRAGTLIRLFPSLKNLVSFASSSGTKYF